MTVKAEKVLNEYGGTQFKWFHRSEKEKYDRLKAEMEEKVSDRDAKLKDKDAKLKDKDVKLKDMESEMSLVYSWPTQY
ncbi:hypothetical protein [Faecalibaculum rodentium]|uniref:hypothetical protein n=2 Tax=Faecalibaculum rodentium TaxID=1702221 RepID=UPI0026EADC39|nr:hypothetical protein [Faecalibaculum rodentium]